LRFPAPPVTGILDRSGSQPTTIGLFQTMAATNSIPTPRRGFIIKQMDSEILLYRHSLKKTIYLNESAAVVWQLCDGERIVQHIVDILADAYPDKRAQVAADVSGAIDSLCREGALRLETGAATTEQP